MLIANNKYVMPNKIKDQKNKLDFLYFSTIGTKTKQEIIAIKVSAAEINPTIASMQSKLWAKHVWKLLWINASMISLGNIIGPFLAGSLYLIWSWLPYIFSSVLFLVSLIFIFIKLKDYK